MVMAFNPDDPHDGHATDELGFTYRMVHIGPDLVGDVLTDRGDRPAGLPLFTEPVIEDPLVARNVRSLHAALVDDAPALRRDELLIDAVTSLARRANALTPWPRTPRTAGDDTARAAYGMAPSDYQRQLRLRAARRLIARGEPLGDIAARTGFADQAHLTRWFSRYYGITPGGYRQAVADEPDRTKYRHVR
jgi:Helix-turn-helix domain/AraC-like ligand binding domain